MFTRKFERRIYIAVAVVGFSLVVGIAFGMYALWPANLERGYQPEQPFPFPHKVMAGDFKVECVFCHSEVERGAHATVPPLSTCMKCHSEIQPALPTGELRPGMPELNAHWEAGLPVIWEKVADLADFVYFDHSRHRQATPRVECEECHGDVQLMIRTERVHALKMAFCLDCHMQLPPEGYPPEKKTRGPISCWTCHR